MKFFKQTSTSTSTSKPSLNPTSTSTSTSKPSLNPTSTSTSTSKPSKFLVIVFLFFSLFILELNSVSAATTYLIPEFKSVAVGDTVIVDVKMDADGKNPNVVEGNILIAVGAEKIEISRLSLAGSVLNYWTQNPSFDQKSSISFVGGAPGGFNQQSGLLFKIVFLAKKEGQVILSPADIKAYDNDGKATPIAVSSNSLNIEIGPKTDVQPKNQWIDVIAGDKMPPEHLIATFGRDDSIFEGKKFFTISAVDDQSGIDYFEVKEGNQPTVRSGETYVLLDQNESSPIAITAYDKAGNHSQVLLKPVKRQINYTVLIIATLIVLLILCGIGFALIKLAKKRKK
jgi:hypothetical protein